MNNVPSPFELEKNDCPPACKTDWCDICPFRNNHKTNKHARQQSKRNHKRA